MNQSMNDRRNAYTWEGGTEGGREGEVKKKEEKNGQ